MNDKFRETILPITYSILYNYPYDGITYFCNVEWLEDWGPYQKGHKSESLKLDIISGFLIERKDEKEFIKIHVRLCPWIVEESSPN